MVKKEEFGYDNIVEYLASTQNFTYARIGDGEWNAINASILFPLPENATKEQVDALYSGQSNKFGHNTDTHKYFPDMGARIRRTVAQPVGYYIGLQNLVKNAQKDNPNFTRFATQQEWCGCEILHHASSKGRLPEMIAELKKRHVVLVGNEHLTGMQKHFDFEHIIVPLENCWLAYEETKAQIQEQLDKGQPDTVVLYCASMMSNVLIDDFYKSHGDQITQIDTGSIFDPYCGRNIRGYHNKLDTTL